MKGGTVLLILMLNLLVAPWLCFASSDGALPPATASENATTVLNKYYPQVRLSTVGLSAPRYENFIAAVRAALKKDEIHGIPVLRCNPYPLLSERYLFVTLTNKAWYSITLKLDVTGAYFTAYRAGNYSCDIHKIISGLSVTCKYARGTSSHVLMEPSSTGSHPVDHLAEDLEGVRWGTNALDEAISSLYRFPLGMATIREWADGIRTCIMMITNAARFQYIERRMSAAIRHGNDETEDPSLHSLALRWRDLSAAIEESHQGVFAAPITVLRRSNEVLPVDSVRRAAPFIALMYCHCQKPLKETQPLPWVDLFSDEIPMLIRSVVQGSADAPACKETEPTSRIVGPDGNCVDVRNGWYQDGAMVQLWPCKSYTAVNQLWTFKRDGTIRSNGNYCLTASGSTPGDYVMIFRCPDSPTDAVVWEVRDDGTIVSKSGLVLSASSTASYTVLAVQTDNRSTGQSWTPPNDTNPFMAAIVGYHDLCLQVDGEDVWVASCVGGKPEQAWALYPDGSIRPKQKQDGCLAPDAKNELKLVQVFPCDPTSSGQRWVFWSDGSILNLGTELVMDVRGSDPSLKQIIVYTATGNPNQKWAPML